MITYNKAEIKQAILKVFPVGNSFSRSAWEQVKWNLILNDGFEKKGFLREDTFFVAVGELRNEGYFERRRNSVTEERFYIRVQ